MEKCVLIVDDEPHIRMLLEQTLEDLEDEGVELLQAVNGQEALDIIQAREPQLVFLDVMMPLMTGIEVCHTVKQKLGLADVYIVLLTAKGQEMDRQQGLDAGANQYMTKPFDPDAIFGIAQEVIGL